MSRIALLLRTAALCLPLSAPAAAQAGAHQPVMTERVGTLAGDGPVAESSGLAVSRTWPDILWTHNDSGGEPVLFAIRPDGSVVGSVRLRGARAVDWESLALGPCPDRPADCLYVGDLGDNAERRTHGTIYYLPEPDPGAPDRPDALVDARAVRVQYVDGPRDVEAIALDGAGALHLITKGRSGPLERYVIPREALRGDSVVVEPVDTLPIDPQIMLGRLVTGAAFSPDRTRIVVRTYTELYFFEPTPEGPWRMVNGPCWLGLTEPQGEAVDFVDGETLLLMGEANPLGDGAIVRVRC